MKTKLTPLLLSTLIVVSSLFIASTSFAEETKIGVVDMQKVMSTLPEGKSAMKKLEATLKAKQAKLDQAKKDFQAFEQKLAKKSSAQPPSAEEQRQYQEKYLAVRNLAAQSQQELEEAQVKAQAKILKKLQKAAEKVAKEKSIDIVLSNGGALGLVYATSKLDITDAVIKSYGK